jgi:hypothetical protein
MAGHGPRPKPWSPATAAGLWGAPVAAGSEARRRKVTRSRSRDQQKSSTGIVVNPALSWSAGAA